MSYALPLNIFTLLESRLGRDEALKVGQAIEASIQVVERRAEEIAVVKKAEIKLELEKDLTSKLMTKEDGAKLEIKIAQLEAKVDTKFAQLDNKTSKHLYIVVAAIVVMNPSAIDLLSKLLGVAK